MGRIEIATVCVDGLILCQHCQAAEDHVAVQYSAAACLGVDVAEQPYSSLASRHSKAAQTRAACPAVPDPAEPHVARVVGLVGPNRQRISTRGVGAVQLGRQ